MIPTPPDGSKITVMLDGADPVIVIPTGSGGAMRYFVGLFLLFWLGGWSVGLYVASSRVISGQAGPFLLFWLGAWIVGGILAGYYLYRVVRPSIPESLRLKPNSIAYDSGIPPIEMNFGYIGSRQQWRSYFPKRTRLELDRRHLQSLRLRETDSGNRLTVDVDATRLDIAQSAGEIDREWLYELLAKRYSVPMGWRVGAAASRVQ